MSPAPSRNFPPGWGSGRGRIWTAEADGWLGMADGYDERVCGLGMAAASCHLGMPCWYVGGIMLQGYAGGIRGKHYAVSMVGMLVGYPRGIPPICRSNNTSAFRNADGIAVYVASISLVSGRSGTMLA